IRRSTFVIHKSRDGTSPQTPWCSRRRRAEHHQLVARLPRRYRPAVDRIGGPASGSSHVVELRDHTANDFPPAEILSHCASALVFCLCVWPAMAAVSAPAGDGQPRAFVLPV